MSNHITGNLPMFIQFHILTPYPASLLNRDDQGLAKRIPFGGTSRIRVSSQCLKRHWRTSDSPDALSKIDGAGMSVRSRATFQKLIRDPLVTEGVDLNLATLVTERLMAVALGESAKAKAGKAKAGKEGEESEDKKDKKSSKDESCLTSQLTVIGHPEIEYLLSEARAVVQGLKIPKKKPTDTELAKMVDKAVKAHFDKERRQNLAGLVLGAGLDAALFGRMVTSDTLLGRCDAPIHVAHAFTVHEEMTESDYFTAVDDLDPDHGSAHLGNVELTSGLFYIYVVVDVPLLISNLTGTPREAWKDNTSDLAGEVLSRLLRLMTKVSPGAKLGSTAPYAHAHFVMAEIGEEQPRTLANAFQRPVPTRYGADLLGGALRQMAGHVEAHDRMYGTTLERKYSCMEDFEGMEKLAATASTVPELGDWIAQKVK